MIRFTVLILVCAFVGAVVSVMMSVFLEDSQGFLAENRTAVIGGSAAIAAVVVSSVFPRSRPAK